MNKKEAQMVEDLRIVAALRWTDDVEKDVPIPEKGLSTGFLFNAYSSVVQSSCSSTTGHNFGSNDRTSSQQPRELFSTKALALKALRHAVEQRVARELRDIDKRIAGCEV